MSFLINSPMNKLTKAFQIEVKLLRGHKLNLTPSYRVLTNACVIHACSE